jgi:hypothetical protein
VGEGSQRGFSTKRVFQKCEKLQSKELVILVSLAQSNMDEKDHGESSKPRNPSLDYKPHKREEINPNPNDEREA